MKVLFRAEARDSSNQRDIAIGEAGSGPISRVPRRSEPAVIHPVWNIQQARCGKTPRIRSDFIQCPGWHDHDRAPKDQAAGPDTTRKLPLSFLPAKSILNVQVWDPRRPIRDGPFNGAPI